MGLRKNSYSWQRTYPPNTAGLPHPATDSCLSLSAPFHATASTLTLYCRTMMPVSCGSPTAHCPPRCPPHCPHARLPSYAATSSLQSPAALLPTQAPATLSHLNTCSCLSLDAMMMKLPSGLMTMSWILTAAARHGRRACQHSTEPARAAGLSTDRAWHWIWACKQLHPSGRRGAVGSRALAVTHQSYSTSRAGQEGTSAMLTGRSGSRAGGWLLKAKA